MSKNYVLEICLTNINMYLTNFSILIFQVIFCFKQAIWLQKWPWNQEEYIHSSLYPKYEYFDKKCFLAFTIETTVKKSSRLLYQTITDTHCQIFRIFCINLSLMCILDKKNEEKWSSVFSLKITKRHGTQKRQKHFQDRGAAKQ